MTLRTLPVLLALLVPAALPVAAQKGPLQLAGTWDAETPDGPRTVIIRADSSASYGDETVRWRVVGDSIHIAFGDEWMVYRYQLKGNRLTLSGGDLEDPISLKRTGPPQPRAEGVPLPEAPPADRRGIGANGKAPAPTRSGGSRQG
ncbi:MAG: hypothetical protein HY549_06495 [Elusimicrobia bacterium]|nr:hypothetical protein [Elusimicrobiota bacterium]